MLKQIIEERDKLFAKSFDTEHSAMTHIGNKSTRRSECEVCQAQKTTNPKGYYKTFLTEQKCYWNDEMFKDVIAFNRETARQLIEGVREIVEEKKRWYSGGGNKPIRTALADIQQELSKLNK